MLRNRLAWMLWPLCLACGSSSSSPPPGGSADSGGGDSNPFGQDSSVADTAPSMGMDSGRMDSATPNDSGGQDTGMDAVAMGGIPDPGAGNGVDNNFGNVEPNDTPQQATPLGTAMTGNVYVWVTSNTIGGSDTSDYFVFKSGPTSGTFSFNICYGAPITSLTATLWQVVNATQQLPPVGTWTANTACVSDMTMPAQLQANTEYLFGLTAVGGAGMYAA